MMDELIWGTRESVNQLNMALHITSMESNVEIMCWELRCDKTPWDSYLQCFPSSNMSIAFLDLSIENQKGGYIKPSWIDALSTIFHEWHLVSFRILIVCLFHHILHISSMMMSATGWDKVMRSMDDRQASWGSAKGMLCLWVVSSDGSNPDRSKMSRQR